MTKRASLIADRFALSAYWLVATLNMLFLVAFLASLFLVGGKAHAETPACTGHDLTAELAADNPALLDKVRAEAASTPNGQGLLWKVSKGGVEPSFLFGTMHMTDPRVTELTPAATAAFDGADTVVIETTDVLDQSAMTAMMLKKPDLMMFTDGTSLSQYLKPDEIKSVESALKARGVPLASVEKMKPWMLVSLVSLPACELARKSAGAPVLDVKLAEKAKAGHKALKGLESASEQLEAMASLPMKLHIRGLVDTLKLGNRIDDVIETMIVLYTKGETGMFMPLFNTVVPDEKTGQSGYAAFEKAVVTTRNHTMARRALPILSNGKAFIAIGALHLPGEEGVIALLRQDGFTVTAVN